MSQNMCKIYWSIDCSSSALKPFHCMSNRGWMLMLRNGLHAEVMDERSHRELEQQNTMKNVLLKAAMNQVNQLKQLKQLTSYLNSFLWKTCLKGAGGASCCLPLWCSCSSNGQCWNVLTGSWNLWDKSVSFSSSLNGLNAASSRHSYLTRKVPNGYNNWPKNPWD